MPSSKQISKANDALDKTLDDLLADDLSLIKASIKRLENNIIDKMHALPVNADGSMRLQRSLRGAQQLHKDIVKEVAVEYGAAVDEMVKGYSGVEAAIATRFAAVDIPLVYSTIDKEMFRALKNQIKYEMGALSVKTTQDIVGGMYDMILTGAKFSDIVGLAKNSLTGIKTKAGKPLSSYASQQVHDSLMGYYSQVEQVKAKDAGIDTFLYYGNLMGSSRAFCIARAGRVFTRKQIDSWNKFRWQGKKPGSVFINRGGYNCRHSLMTVRRSWVKTGKIDTQTYWTQPGMKMPDTLAKEVAKEERRLASFSAKPPIPDKKTWQKASNVKDLDRQLNEKFQIKKFSVAGIDKTDDITTLNIGNKVGAELTGFAKDNPSLRLKDLDLLEVHTTDYISYEVPGFGKSIAVGLFNFKKGRIQLAVGKFYDPKIKKLSRIAGKKDIIEKGNFSPYKQGTPDWVSVFRHEYGHHVDMPLVTKESKSFLSKAYRDRGAKYWEENLSVYAASNSREMFAEAYSLASSPNYKLGMLPAEVEKIILPMTKGLKK